MFSLQRKLVIYLIMIWAAPLYVIVRHWYGKAFYRLVLIALAINLIVLPYTLDTVAQESGINLSGVLYMPSFSQAVAKIGIYALSLHLYWIVFSWLSSDTRYDLDNPGRAPLPIHPLLIDIPAACAFPFLILSLRETPSQAVTYHLWFPTFLREFIPDWLVTADFAAYELSAAVTMSAAYLAVCFMTTPLPSFRRRRKLKPTPTQPQFDVAKLASVPSFKRDTIATIMSRRSRDLQELTRRSNSS